jgi:hypothetical protein
VNSIRLKILAGYALWFGAVVWGYFYDMPRHDWRIWVVMPIALLYLIDFTYRNWNRNPHDP